MANDVPVPPHDPNKFIPAPPPGPADPNLLIKGEAVPLQMTAAKGGVKTFAEVPLSDLKFKESKPRDPARSDLLKATWQSQMPKPPAGDPEVFGPQPEGRVFMKRKGQLLRTFHRRKLFPKQLLPAFVKIDAFPLHVYVLWPL